MPKKKKPLYETDCKYCKADDIRPCPVLVDKIEGTGKFNITENCPWKAWFDNVDPENFRRVYRI